jgi:glucose-1-phosphate adenylyltransferase
MQHISSQVLAVILGGGAGTRLYPLTASRSKPAVPIAGKYRLVDIPISNCINSGINRMFVLTQFNSASLNKHIKNTYQFSVFSSGFVDILAAEQTPDNPGWFQGTADAVRQSLRHISNLDFEYVLILSGDCIRWILPKCSQRIRPRVLISALQRFRLANAMHLSLVL